MQTIIKLLNARITDLKLRFQTYSEKPGIFAKLEGLEAKLDKIMKRDKAKKEG